MVKDSVTAAVIEQGDSFFKYALFASGNQISYRRFIDLLSDDCDFRQSFNSLMVSAPFEAYRLETPALTNETLDIPFEFVLLEALNLTHRQTDKEAFSEYYNPDECSPGIVKFKSLGADAELIVPSPRASEDTYNHLARFVREAPAYQTNELWRVVGISLKRIVGQSPVWLNTEGSGVAWLHVRIDSRPKYYGFDEYRNVRVDTV